MRFFFAENTNRLIHGMRFEPIDVFCGTIRGVFATNDVAVALLLANTPGVQEINEAGYDDRLKKKAGSIENLSGLRPNLTPAPRLEKAPIAAKVGVVVESGDIKKGKKSKTVETTKDALKLGEVDAPQD